MWVGYDRIGQDEVIVCQACHGQGEVPQYQIIDTATGQEIDYEAFGRTKADAPEHLQE
jgi:RecJ-like exonuclease